MEEVRNAEGNSPTDISPSTTSPSATEYINISPESSTPQSANREIDNGHKRELLIDSEMLPVKDSLAGPLKILIPTDTDQSQHGLEDVSPSSSENFDTQHPHFSDVAKAQSNNVSHRSGICNAVGKAYIQVEDVTSSNISNLMIGTENGIHSVLSGTIGVPQVKVASVSEPIYPSKHVKQIEVGGGVIDTAAPIESVKDAVTKYGGIVDWKAHKILTAERRKDVEVELEKAQEDLPRYTKHYEAAENAKAEVLKELDSTRKLIEELKLNVEKAQTEENQAKQDSELAHLRAEEMEQGIANEASIAAKAQLEVAKARHVTAVADLKLVKEEMESLKADYISLVSNRDLAVKRAEEAVSAMQETEKMVEKLTLEMITAKGSLESAHAAHLEAEEKRIAATMAQEQGSIVWEKELKQAEEELMRLNEQILSAKDLESKLSTASELLWNLKAELAAYAGAKLAEVTISAEKEDNQQGKVKARIFTDTQAIMSSAEQLDEVRLNIEKAKDDINCLKVAATSLRLELDKERAEISATRQREGMATVTVSTLEAELSGIQSELELVQLKQKETKERMVELPMELQEASEGANQAKLELHSAREELRKVKEEAEQAKAGASTVESRLLAALKEIEAAKAAERLALAAAKALQESEMGACQGSEDDTSCVTLPLEDYYTLSKQAREAEEVANLRVAAAIAQIEVAKESQLRSLEALEEANMEMAETKEALRIAMEKADKANEGKLGVEQELRKWRAESEQRRKAGDHTGASTANHVRNPPGSFDVEEDAFASGPKASVPGHKGANSETELKNGPVDHMKAKKKKSFFPRIVMFLARKKSHSK